MVGIQPLSPSQRGFSLWLGVSLPLIGTGVAAISALQSRAVVRGLGAMEIPRGYWTNLGVWLNFVLAIVALALAVRFLFSTSPGSNIRCRFAADRVRPDGGSNGVLRVGTGESCAHH